MELTKEYLDAQMNMMASMLQQMTNLTNSWSQQQQGSSIAQIPLPLQVSSGELNDNLSLFESNWKSYCDVTGMSIWTADKESTKANILWSAIGDEAKLKFNNFYLEEAERQSTDVIFNKIKAIICKNDHSLYERWDFFNCAQHDNESFDGFLLRIRKMADNCQFEKIPQAEIKNIMIRGRLCFSIKDNQLKKTFLKQDPGKLLLEDVIKQCQVSESTEEKFNMITGASDEIHKISNKNFSVKNKCKFCGLMHEFVKGKCPAISKKCLNCNRLGHFKRCCPGGSSNSRQVHNIEMLNMAFCYQKTHVYH